MYDSRGRGAHSDNPPSPLTALTRVCSTFPTVRNCIEYQVARTYVTAFLRRLLFFVRFVRTAPLVKRSSALTRDTYHGRHERGVGH